MGLLSNESSSSFSSNFAAGLEFEETFPEPESQEPAPQRSAPRKLTVVRAEPTPAAPQAEAIVAPGQELDRRQHEAEVAVAQTVARSVEPGRMNDDALAVLAQAASVRDVGRILRDMVSETAHTSAFALAMHHTQRDEVAYRYRVASDDELGALLRREALDDDPNSAAAHSESWVRARRAVRVGGRNTFVHTAQLSVRSDGVTIGVLSLQTEGEALTDEQLARIAGLVERATPRLADLRARGAFRSL